MRNVVILKVFLLLWMISGAMSIYAQYVFRHIDVTDGLSDNQVKSLNITPDGLLSIRTTAVVNFYNGSTFSYIRHDERQHSTWQYAGIHKEYFDAENRMWMKERGNLFLLDLTTNQFIYNWPAVFTAMGIPGKLKDLFIDDEKNYWCLTEDNNFYCYDIHQKKLIQILDGQSQLIRLHGLPRELSQYRQFYWIIYEDGYLQCWDLQREQFIRQDGYFQNVINDQTDRVELSFEDGNLWMMYNKGISFYDAAQNKWKDIDIPLSNWDLLTCMDRDANGNIWVGSSKSGLRIIDGKSFEILHLPLLTLETGESINNDIHSIKIDSMQGVWLGTFNQGVLYYHPAMHKFSQLEVELFPTLKSRNVRCMLEEEDGSILLGTSDGLLRYNSFNNSITVPFEELEHELCLTLYRDKQGRIWIGTFLNGLFCLSDEKIRHYYYKDMTPRSLPNYNNIRAFCEDKSGQFWVSVYGGLATFDEHTGSINLLCERYPKLSLFKIVTSLTNGDDGSITVAADNGIYYYHPSKDMLWIPEIDTPEDSCYWHSNRKYNCIYKDSRSLMWFGTQDGLNVLDPSKHTLRTFYQSDGLPNNAIQGIMEDNERHIWLSTPNGISRVKIEDDKYIFTNFSSDDGVQQGEFYERSVLKAKDGTIYFGGVNGITVLSPKQPEYNDNQYRAYFTSLKLYNTTIRENEPYQGHIILERSINHTKKIDLKYNENFISLEFAGLNFINPARTYYRYKLEGFDRDWTEIIATNGLGKVTYTALAPGKYEFKIYTADNSNSWGNKYRELEIIIHPPFWATIYAFIIYGILFMATILGIVRWITYRNKVALQRQQHEELDQMKFRFFTNISHEFRTPLTLIITPLDTILKKMEDGPLKKQLSSIYRSAEELLKLVNQLLDFRKLEIKGEILNLDYGDMVEFLYSVYNSFHEMAIDKRVRLDWNPTVDSVYMYFDKDKVRKIVNNLLSNAFKFTPQDGEIVLSVSKSQDTGTKQYVSICISDTGIGINKKDIERIFDRFYQAVDQTGTERIMGSGIGLHLIKEYTQLHQGEVRVNSKPNEGSTFTVLLPLDLYPAKDRVEILGQDTIVEGEQESSCVMERKKTILVVEDNDEFRRFMVEHLGEYYRVLEAPDGEVGESIVISSSPDLIVTDIMMPKVDGLELCRRIKTNIHVSHIPVILLTARISDETKTSGYEAGADSYISKPFSFDMLLTRIRKLIEQQTYRKEIFHRTIEVNPSEITITPLDEQLVKKALELVEENIDNTEYSVEDLSADVGMHRMNLYRKLQSITGQTPSEFIRSIRLKRAAQLLQGSQLSVSEVADKVGFNTPKYFTKYFKEMFGVTPSQYASQKQGDKM